MLLTPRISAVVLAFASAWPVTAFDDCSELPVREALARADVVFLGQVTSHRAFPGRTRIGTRLVNEPLLDVYEFRISHSWKRRLPERVEVSNTHYVSDQRLSIGGVFLVYASVLPPDQIPLAWRGRLNRSILLRPGPGCWPRIVPAKALADNSELGALGKPLKPMK